MNDFYDNPDEEFRTACRETHPSDIAHLHNIDVKCHDFAMERVDILRLTKVDGVVGLMAVQAFKNVGFVLFTAKDNLINIVRISVIESYIHRGVLKAILTTLRTTPVGKEPAIRCVLSENDAQDSQLFDALRSHGFLAIGIIPKNTFEYGSWVDGIKLELPQGAEL